MATFYMVYVDGSSTPTKEHTTLASAELEAKRLSETLQKKAFVLCTIKSFQVNKFTVEDCRPDPYELPF